MSLDLLTLFNRDALIRRLKDAAILESVVMDEVFTHRPQLASPTVPIHEIQATTRTLPLIQRGGPSIGIAQAGSAVSVYEALPISFNITVSAADLNNLRNFDPQSLETWANQKTEQARRLVRRTTEGMAAQALNGRISWPLQLSGGGTDVYEVHWGSTISVAPSKKFDDTGASLVDVTKTLTAMRNAMKRKGFGGGQVKVWAGENAFYAIMALAEKYTGSSIKLEIEESALVVAGTKIILRSEEYPHPVQKNTWVPVLAKNLLRMIDVSSGGHQMPYCALDDLDAKLAPLPIFIKPIKQDDPSGYKLVVQSKPFPVPNMDAVADAEVV